MAANTKPATKRATKKPATKSPAKKTVAKKGPATPPAVKSSPTPAETYKMVEELVASGLTQQAAFAEVGDKTGRSKNTIQGVHFHYRKKIGASPRGAGKKPTAKRASATRAKAPARTTRTATASSSAATSATNAIQALIDENEVLRRELAEARKKADLYDKITSITA